MSQRDPVHGTARLHGDKLTFGSLFAGIGGFDLGFERAGMECQWQVEIDPYCQQVLAKHWPNVRRYADVKSFPPVCLTEPWKVDVICGGFPCQDISNANRNAVGINGERSGLWCEFARIVRFLLPNFIVVENVPALSFRGLDTVLGDLAACGYDAEWNCLPSAAFGAPHYRNRLFVLAYPAGWRLDGTSIFQGASTEVIREPRCKTIREQGHWHEWAHHVGYRGGVRLLPAAIPDRGCDGLSEWMDPLRAIGNSVCPQVAEWIGRRIIEVSDSMCVSATTL